MSEVMACPHCGGTMQITPEFRGKVVRCPHCLKDLSIPPAAQVPPAPPPPPAIPGVPAEVPNHLVWAILVTIFCCLPFGIVAIVYAAQVSSRLAARDYAGALAASRSARMWCWIALIVGLVASPFWVFSLGFFPFMHPHHVIWHW